MMMTRKLSWQHTARQESTTLCHLLLLHTHGNTKASQMLLKRPKRPLNASTT
jgi:hypothetical protein